jgi:gamma-glutamylcyclotransferase (GGCT)/AIG2-like uncharacterized protein YtfP
VAALAPFALLGLDAADWQAVGEMLLGVGAISTGLWSIFNYRRTRQYGAAAWLQGVYKDFYLADTFAPIRQVLEYHYAETAGPLLSRRILDRQIPPTGSEEVLLRELDTLLNYFEYVLYLEDKHQLSKKDRLAVFEYWFDLLKEPECASLRRYAVRFRFERVVSALGAHKREYVAVYGSLRQGFGLPGTPDLGDRLRARGPCRIPGKLYDLGGYPGLVSGDGDVAGELYEVPDLSVFPMIDAHERYNADDCENSLYLRKAVRLHEPANIDAWVYVYNREIADKPLIDNGDWATYPDKARARELASGQPKIG